VQNEIRAAGATHVTISPQTFEKSRELTEARRLTLPILRDEGNAYARRFNILNGIPDELRQIFLNFGIDLAASNGEDSWTLPIPGSYVVDRTGTIRYAATDPDYTKRPEPEEMLEALGTLE
jgi:peroxiredoxin